MATETDPNRVALAEPVDASGFHIVKAAKITSILALVGTVITAGAALISGWLQWAGPGSSQSLAEEPAIPARIISPIDGDLVPQCTAVRGIGPTSDGSSSLWLVVHPISGDNNYYLSRRVEIVDRFAPAWDLGKIVVGGAPGTVHSEKYELILVQADKALGEYLAGHVGESLGATLPPKSEEVHKISVKRSDVSEC